MHHPGSIQLHAQFFIRSTQCVVRHSAWRSNRYFGASVGISGARKSVASSACLRADRVERARYARQFRDIEHDGRDLFQRILALRSGCNPQIQAASAITDSTPRYRMVSLPAISQPSAVPRILILLSLASSVLTYVSNSTRDRSRLLAYSVAVWFASRVRASVSSSDFA